MAKSFIIGLDYGTESARGVLIDAATGEQVAHHAHPYRHGVMTQALADGTPLPRGWALQDAADYLEAAQDILARLGRDKAIESIGIDFTASSPMPAAEDGTALSNDLPGDPHAYVKLWKHGAAQPFADAINMKGGAFLDHFGGKLSGEWLLAKAAQIASEAPQIWARTSRFIESGDWLVWQLTGTEARSLGLAAYKAQYSEPAGYPDIVAGLLDKLSVPLPVGSPVGSLSAAWRASTGIEGRAIVAVAVIDSHAVLPAIGAVATGCLTAALGTSAAYLYLSENPKPLPKGIEGMARDGSVRGLWCYEAGQASFGDTLAWFVRAFPRAGDLAENFAIFNAEAGKLPPGANHLVALDWWNGNRVPLSDSGLSGVLLGLNMNTTPAAIYRALIESICFGGRSVVDLFEAGNLGINRVILTSGLARNNPLLVQIMTDVLERPVDIPEIANATAVGAAIHGAVAAGLVDGYPEGTARFGARTYRTCTPRKENAPAYRALYETYAMLCNSETLRTAMHTLNRITPSPA